MQAGTLPLDIDICRYTDFPIVDGIVRSDIKIGQYTDFPIMDDIVTQNKETKFENKVFTKAWIFLQIRIPNGNDSRYIVSTFESVVKTMDEGQVLLYPFAQFLCLRAFF